ncbi:MFS transporter [Streptococcus sp. S784/96/1]|uniref:MFS transporter n=1 Tax=Streptococcus sp. S784/96/1 TaxID=2653499 RepID=UPI0013875B7C|nr:MFS transporter [Streptococcus sp. S784/96/1]
MSNLSIFYLYTIFMNGRFGRGVLMLYSLSLGVTALEFGFLQSLYNLTRMLAEIPAGLIADRFDKKIILALGASLNAISSFGLWLTAYSPSNNRLLVLALLFMLDALASVLASGADQALLFEDVTSRQHDKSYLRLMSNLQTIALVILACTTAVGGPLFEHLYASVFGIQALCYTLATVTISAFQSTITEIPKNSLSSFSITQYIRLAYQTLRKYPILLYLILAMTVIEGYVNALVTFGQGAFTSQGLSDSLIATIIGGVTFCGILGAYLARFFETLSLQNFFTFITGIFAAAVFTFSGGHPLLMIFGFTLANLLVDLTFPYISSTINHTIDNAIRATILSIYSSLVGGLSLLLYPILGFLMDTFSYQTAFLINGLTFILTLVSLRVMVQKS